MTDEVRFDRMVPSAIVARRDECNLAYLPVGALEWHGAHMPFGTDSFTVTYLAEEAAKRFGGVAFPPMYYGDVRYNLHDCREEWRSTYTSLMDVPDGYASAFPHGEETEPTDDGHPAAEPLPFPKEEQHKQFVRNIAHVMLEIHLYGFQRIILLPGHAPNWHPCQEAEEVYRENVLRRSAFGPPARTLTFFYIEPAKEFEPLLNNHWIHADKWEGSVTMVAAPGTVKPELLPDDPDTLAPAYLGKPYLTETDGYNEEMQDLWHSFDALDPRNGTDEGYGRQQMEAILGRFGEAVREFAT